ncbi:acetolactate synthase large subunit [Blautia sp. HCP3S3_H10_1]|uniref:acetolactate synthase large subunit n=1 Tax=unclassified Blautia TaxID=2648079 RepID=UPI003F9312F3
MNDRAEKHIREEVTEPQKKQESCTAAEVLVKCLEKEGVEYVFGIPGEENLDMMNALEKSSIRVIVVRHEQGAAFMADMYGRLTGKAGVCFSTLGPGAANLITGTADANSDGAPVIAITGQVGTERMHLTSHQYLDLVELFAPITKRSKQIVNPDSVNEIMRIAFKYAESEKPGACHVDLPTNVAKMKVTPGLAEIPIDKQIYSKEYASFSSIDQAAALIYKAKHPVILAGHSAVRNHAGEALTSFADELKIPVVNTMMAKGIIPYKNKYSMWTIGIPQKDYQNEILDMADLVIAVGYDIVEFAPGKWNDNDKHKIIHIDQRPAHINMLYQPQVQVIGDISYSLQQIQYRSDAKEEPTEILGLKKEMVAEYESYAEDTSFPMKPQKILYDVRKFMGEDDIVISDVGAHKMWIAREYNCYKPNTCIISNGFATMGIAVPGAVAAKLVNPNKKVLAISGDGGFMMNSQEYETALREGAPIVTLIFSDASYGLIKWKQMDHFGKNCFVDFTNPDFVKYAESMHAKGYRVEKAEDLIPILEDAFKQTVPCIIDCPVDYSENTKLSEYLHEKFE